MASVTVRNIYRNTHVSPSTAKAGSETSREPLPFRGGLDVSPMPRASVSRSPMIVTAHAVLRFQERVANVSAEAATEALSSPVIQQAARFGAPYVRLGTGQRVVIEDGKVITVLPKDHPAGRMMWRGKRDG